MRVLCIGSLNIDHVYRVDHLVRPGETIASTEYQVSAGGKGANQAAALARAGAVVSLAGHVGPEGAWLVDRLSQLGVDTQWARVVDVPTGHAIIQVDADGQNSIVLYAGANRTLTAEWAESVLANFGPGDVLLLQNEVNDVPGLVAAGRRHGLQVCLNPAPCGPEVGAYPLDQVDLLVVNETEATALVGARAAEGQLACLGTRYPTATIVLTLGPHGAWARSPVATAYEPAADVPVVDTTGAGDTFLGFFLAAQGAGLALDRCLRRASRAAGLCVSRAGATDSVPTAAEVDALGPSD
jgi:ribokinase